ncbi:MAG: hypothetical protein MUF30_01500 [Burkholderiales bacterium]|jgi:hypothetical protein|nr:hypothetical protein [Burkholderiales bacterium]
MAEPAAQEAQMDATDLYREEIVTDRRVGTIRVMHPIDATGAPDAARPTLFLGEAQIMTTVGALPLAFEIPGDTLAQAVAGYGEAARDAMEKAVRELQDMRRQAASSIVVPGAGGGGAMGGLGGGGGFGGGGFGGAGGGKIRLP